jgi:hypothetical protein
MSDKELIAFLRDLPFLRAATAADRIEALMAKLAKTVEALAFYANEENYKGVSLTDPCGCCSSWYNPKIHIGGEDSGHIARAIIAEIEGSDAP